MAQAGEVDGGGARRHSSLRAHYRTGSEGQRRGVRSSGAISARLPASTPVDVTESIRASSPRAPGRRDDVHELLEVARGPALERRRAVPLVGGHHRVAVVPVELRPGLSQKVRPERSAISPKISACGSRRSCASPSTITVERGGARRRPPRRTRARRGRSPCSPRRRRRRPRGSLAGRSAGNPARARRSR